MLRLKKINMNTDKKPSRFKKKHKVLLGIVLILVAIRLALPYVILHFANKTLATMDGYYGKIRDIDLAIYRGAYKVKDIYLHKKDSVTNMETDFFDAQLIDLSIHWGALLEGKIVGGIKLEGPSIYFTKDKVEPKEVVQDSSDFRKLLDDFMPLRVNRFEIKSGTIKYIDHTSSPKVDIEMNNTFVRAENLTNVKGGSTLPSTVTASADIYDGTLEINMKLDPLAEDPTFDMNAELKNTNLVKLNDFFKAYGKFDVTHGIFGLYVEGAGKDGKFVGYFKPIIKDLKVIGPEDKDDNLLKKFWEGTVGAVGIVFRNQRYDQVGTKVPIEGTFEKTQVKVLTAVVEVLRNAFIEALRPTIDNEINLGTVDEGTVKQGPLKDMFKDKDKENTNEPDIQVKEPEEKKEKKGIFKKIFNGKKKDTEHEEEKPK
jgi:hypothetical protein